MKQLVIICGENKLRCEQILELLAERNKDIEILLRVTTNTAENAAYTVVPNNEFWDMVEQGKFMEYSGTHNNYYGTLHININRINNQFIVNDVNVALDIKKMYSKAITIFVLSKEEAKFFKTSMNKYYSEARKLDFLVVDEDLICTVKKIEEIVQFIEKNGMKSS